MSVSGFEYAQARLQAHHASRPDAAAWRRLHASAGLEHFLEACERTGLSAWVADLHPEQDARTIERALDGAFRRYAVEVASWLPARWQATVRSVPFAERDADVDEWRAEWPRTSRTETAALDELFAVLDAHRERMRAATPAEDGFRLCDQLATELSRLFRRRTQQPVTPLSHLALTALDLERLRGAVLRRALFPDIASEASWV